MLKAERAIERSPLHSVKIHFIGVGGQGTLLATRIIGELMVKVGRNVVASEIHGMAQRGGVVESSLLVGDLHSPLIMDGDADILVGFEPVEALRAVSKCSSKTCAVINDTPVIPFTVAIGNSTYPTIDHIHDSLGKVCGRVFGIDAEGIAKGAGSARTLNVVMLGALSALVFPEIGQEMWEDVISSNVPPKVVEINRKAFRAGRESLSTPVTDSVT